MIKKRGTSIRDIISHFQVLLLAISICLACIHLLPSSISSPIGIIFLRAYLFGWPSRHGVMEHLLKRSRILGPKDSQHRGNHGLIPIDQLWLDHLPPPDSWETSANIGYGLSLNLLLLPSSILMLLPQRITGCSAGFASPLSFSFCWNIWLVC